MTKMDDIYIMIKSQNNMKQWNNILNHSQKQTHNEPLEHMQTWTTHMNTITHNNQNYHTY
jgi:hypothetical protein